MIYLICLVKIEIVDGVWNLFAEKLGVGFGFGPAAGMGWDF